MGEGVPGFSTLWLEGPNRVLATSEGAAPVSHFLDESSPIQEIPNFPTATCPNTQGGVGRGVGT